jgi:hypothetical protein
LKLLRGKVWKSVVLSGIFRVRYGEVGLSRSLCRACLLNLWGPVLYLE